MTELEYLSVIIFVVCMLLSIGLYAWLMLTETEADRKETKKYSKQYF